MCAHTRTHACTMYAHHDTTDCNLLSVSIEALFKTSVLVFGLEITLLEIGVVWHCAVCAALTDSDAAC